MIRRSLGWGVVLCLAGGAGAHGQISGGLVGRVTDATGAAVAHARLTLTDTSTHIAQSSESTGDGYYTFPQLKPGSYSLSVAAGGFAPVVRSGLTVATGEAARVDVSLKVGAENATVTVTSDAPLLQSTQSDVETNIPGRTVQAIPLNTRNFIQLATLAPGVSLPPGTLLPRINGGRPRTNEYLYDGISALQPEPGQVVFFPILDDIHEFTIESNNVPAEFGRFNGGVVNVTTRSGSNEFHGSLFEYLRNEDLNARNYFAKATARKPEYRRNLYGGTVGGPILRDHLFFFADYQGIRQAIGVVRTSTIPTLKERQGIFTGVSHIYNPATTVANGNTYTRTEFPNDVITTPLDPAAVALLARLPLPTSSGTANNYTRVANDIDHENQFDVRVDGARGEHDRAFGRYSFYQQVAQPVSPLPEGSGLISGSVLGSFNYSGLTHITGQQAVFNETHTVTPHLLNDLRLGYTRRGNTTDGVTLANTASAALGIPGIPTNASFNNALPLFTFTGYQQLGVAPSTFSAFQTGVWQLVDTVEWIHGAHAIRAGVDARWYQLNTVSPPNPTGSFAFTTTGTNLPSAANSGNSFASFLLGQVDTFSIDLQQQKLRPRDTIQEFFVQDDWKPIPNLTLNLGARWTLHHPSTEKNNQGAVFNLATQQLDYLGRDGYPNSARELHYDNVAPRLGLTYLVTPQTVVRAGYGIVFIDQSGITTPFTTPQFPFIQNVQQRTQDSINAAFELAHGPTVAPIALTRDAGLGQSVYTVDRHAGSGYSQQWNLAVQRAITQNLSVEVGYVGSHIVHVGIPDANLNQLTSDQLTLGNALTKQVPNPYYGQLPASSPIGGKTVAAAQLLKPYPRFQNVAIYRHNSGTTNYNALEAKVEQRTSHGLTLLFSYTYSKLIDDASSVFSSTVLSSPNSSSLVAADTYRPALERDASTGDTPNVIAASAVYSLPAGRGHSFASHGWADAVLGGWDLNGILTVQSGAPVTITQATNNNAFAGFVLQRPFVKGRTSLPAGQRTPQRFFNTAAFTTAGRFALGNASRNPVRGPAYRDLDLALVKHFSLPERAQIEFRAELFNVTNTPAFAQPNGSFGSPAFGSITSTVTDPRVAQFALRISR